MSNDPKAKAALIVDELEWNKKRLEKAKKEKAGMKAIFDSIPKSSRAQLLSSTNEAVLKRDGTRASAVSLKNELAAKTTEIRGYKRDIERLTRELNALAK